jgi:hypothetical protein
MSDPYPHSIYASDFAILLLASSVLFSYSEERAHSGDHVSAIVCSSFSNISDAITDGVTHPTTMSATGVHCLY